MLPFYKAINRWLGGVEKLFMLLSALSLFLIMIITVVDVVLRYVFNAPLHFSTGLVTIYLFPAIVFLSLSDTFRKNENVEIDIMSNYMPGWLKTIGMVIGLIGALMAFLFIAYLYYFQLVDAYVTGEFVFGVVKWLKWPSWLIVVAGCLVLVLRLLHRIIGLVAAVELKCGDEYKG